MARRAPRGRTGRPSPQRERFEHLDPYRVDREWQRYEGTAQRDLFRELRNRFLARHAAVGRWVVDVGSGPGRFLPHLGSEGAGRVALDLSFEMLRRVARKGRRPPHLVRGDGLAPPFVRGGFAEVAVLGNAIGFAGEGAETFLDSVGDLVRPNGILLLEVVAGPGERSRYLSRLPRTSLARLLRAPVRAVVARADREGFAPESVRRKENGAFRRFAPQALGERYRSAGWEVRETLAIAPALGAVPEALEAVRLDAKAWAHLTELEEAVGRRPERWPRAAAVLLALAPPAPPKGTIK
jgi:SAM-dependent methyltransferase